MKYCSRCGSPVQLRVPPGDDRPRHVCDACHEIHYQNPKVVVGCIPEWGEQVLLCRRAIEPQYGLWTLPAGFMELGETASEAALRETAEEAHARVELLGLYTLFNLAEIGQVYLLLRARLLDLDFGAGSESLEVRLFREEEIPWGDLAFAAVRETLRLYFQDRRAGKYAVHMGDITLKTHGR
ncbi:MAG TPA: NUDIX hydrolase [Candidatus Polarisedimenticolia bacterium]|nr:NUDIX hydrolase [Candidatus Polarisedimenticolia bacterium]